MWVTDFDMFDWLMDKHVYWKSKFVIFGSLKISLGHFPKIESSLRLSCNLWTTSWPKHVSSLEALVKLTPSMNLPWRIKWPRRGIPNLSCFQRKTWSMITVRRINLSHVLKITKPWSIRDKKVLDFPYQFFFFSKQYTSSWYQTRKDRVSSLAQAYLMFTGWYW